MTFSIKTPDINFILSYSRCNQKQMSACLEGLFKHASWKIYGRVWNLIVWVCYWKKTGGD